MHMWFQKMDYRNILTKEPIWLHEKQARFYKNQSETSILRVFASDIAIGFSHLSNKLGVVWFLAAGL